MSSLQSSDIVIGAIVFRFSFHVLVLFLSQTNTEKQVLIFYSPPTQTVFWSGIGIGTLGPPLGIIDIDAIVIP